MRSAIRGMSRIYSLSGLEAQVFCQIRMNRQQTEEVIENERERITAIGILRRAVKDIAGLPGDYARLISQHNAGD